LFVDSKLHPSQQGAWGARQANSILEGTKQGSTIQVRKVTVLLYTELGAASP